MTTLRTIPNGGVIRHVPRIELITKSLDDYPRKVAMIVSPSNRLAFQSQTDEVCNAARNVCRCDARPRLSSTATAVPIENAEKFLFTRAMKTLRSCKRKASTSHSRCRYATQIRTTISLRKYRSSGGGHHHYLVDALQQLVGSIWDEVEKPRQAVLDILWRQSPHEV